MRLIIRFWIIVAVVLTVTALCASTFVQAEQSTLSSGSTDERQFNEDTWEELTGDLDYWKDQEKKKEVKPAREIGEISLGPLKYVLLGLVVVLLAAILIRVFASELFRPSKKLEDLTLLRIGELEEDLTNAPLDSALKDCIANGHFKAAVRIYYLMALKRMNERRFIKWHREKTNNQYLAEMRGKNGAVSFQKATRTFEQIWYGPMDHIDEQVFRLVEPIFLQLLTEIER